MTHSQLRIVRPPVDPEALQSRTTMHGLLKKYGLGNILDTRSVIDFAQECQKEFGSLEKAAHILKQLEEG